MIKTTNKNNKIIIEVMDWINLNQLKIQKNYTTVQQCNIK
jgi:hypothetical protein